MTALTLVADQNRPKKLQLTEIVWKLWKLINVFTCVAAVGNAKTKVKVKVLEKTSLEVVSLNHTKAVNGSVAHCELHTEVYKEKTRKTTLVLMKTEHKSLIMMCSDV